MVKNRADSFSKTIKSKDSVPAKVTLLRNTSVTECIVLEFFPRNE